MTLDRALVEAANAAVAGGRADSLSAWINLAVAEHVAKERRLAALSDLLAGYESEFGVITPSELAARERDDRRKATVIRGSGKSAAGKRRPKVA